MRYWRISLVAVLAAVGTVVLGWWSLLLVGLLGGRGRGLETAGAAALGWGALLAWSATGAPVWRLAGQVGAVLGLPAAGLVGVTLVFAALLAGSTALLAASLRR